MQLEMFSIYPGPEMKLNSSDYVIYSHKHHFPGSLAKYEECESIMYGSPESPTHTKLTIIN